MAEKTVRRIALGADHAGYAVKDRIKEILQKQGYEVIDFGAHAADSVDYPDYAKQVAQSVSQAESDRGVLVCGTGIGMAITANKFRGIRAATCNDTYTARMAAEHTDANPAHDPDLSARLLTELGRTVPLPHQVMETL